MSPSKRRMNADAPHMTSKGLTGCPNEHTARP
ncbi:MULTISPECIES: hypothetical protein [Bifidobacterium]|nr:hypothetical protein EGX97_10265 [Bifidobacterium breve]MBN2923922.1 hypothetical protein [Bifidobacterium sp.]KAB1932271.1 hypothetical protein F8275_09140 [Bifidobacterium breve]MBS6384897.1 hypothetical protein [Bifidobacterium breve]MED7618401.1 hypothetical protein [Bifidobacterium breve]